MAASVIPSIPNNIQTVNPPDTPKNRKKKLNDSSVIINNDEEISHTSLRFPDGPLLQDSAVNEGDGGGLSELDEEDPDLLATGGSTYGGR